MTNKSKKWPSYTASQSSLTKDRFIAVTLLDESSTQKVSKFRILSTCKDYKEQIAQIFYT